MPNDIGHNRPPMVDPERIKPYEDRVRDFADAAGAWLDLKVIDDEPTAQRLNDFINGTRKLTKEIEDERKQAKQPYLDAGKEVDRVYNGLTGPLAKAVVRAKSLLTDYARRKAEAERKAQEEARRRAEAELAKARAEAEAAQRRNDVISESDAEERLKEAEKAAKAAARDRPVGRVASATGGGRTAALRTYWDVRIDRPKSAILWLLDAHPRDLMDLIEAKAKADKRHNNSLEIPGVTFIKRQEIA